MKLLSSDDYILHSILYAKGHYHTDPSLAGLRIIVGHYAGMDPEFINDEHLLHYIIMVVKKFKPDYEFENMIFRAFKDKIYWSNDGTKRDTITMMDLIQCALSEIRFMKVVDLPILPKADPTIYPLREKENSTNVA